MVEIGCGGFPGKAHCDAAELLADAGKRKAFVDVIHGHGLEISALSSHGNMVHPDKAIAKAFDDDLTNAILLAEELGVPVVRSRRPPPGAGPPARPSVFLISSLFLRFLLLFYFSRPSGRALTG